MAKKKKQNNSNIKLFNAIFIILIVFYVIITYGKGDIENILNNSIPNLPTETTSESINETTENNKDHEVDNNKEDNKTNQSDSIIENGLKIYYLDVGQADSILINLEDEYMLIDAGNNEDGDKLVNYFNSLGITEFKYVIGTHAHEDHIGGMDNIINSFKIDTFYMPDAMTTTKTFEDVLDALNNKGVQFQTPEIDSTFYLKDAQIKVIYTGTDTKDLNNTSIVLKLTYKNTTYLFTGDTTSTTESKLLDKDIECDVLKVGHHGSQYSSTDKFLNKVNPQYAIISVGKNNTYNHPASTTLTKLEKLKIKVYRTDELGTILLTSDGSKINFSTLSTDTNG